MNPSTRRILFALAVALLALCALAYAVWPRPARHSVDYKMPGNPAAKINEAAAAILERREKNVDQTIWAKELLAQAHGRIFDDIWDSLNAATNKMAVASQFAFEQLTLGSWDSVEHGPHQIELRSSSHPGKVVSRDEWRELLRKFSMEGWRLLQCEFRHTAFDPETNGVPARSRVYFSADLTNTLPARATLKGDLRVEWRLRVTNAPPSIARIDASRLAIQTRLGPPAFVPWLNEAFAPPALNASIEPLNVYDLDGDGFAEIILPALNRVFRKSGHGFATQNLYPKQRLQILNGLFGDFDGDGTPDFVYVGFEGVFLMKGGPGGTFEAKPRMACGSLADFNGPRALTCGDINGDGHLDLFIGQYRGPFAGGNMPMPYYNANDGFPAYLLVNDGQGNFTDSTAAAGLVAKRFRRVYAASFVDLDDNGTLDLVVTSDFAGVDVFRNNGRGEFRDVSDEWLTEPHAFGMAHAFGDFNNDGRLDFYAAGMNSPTADRLEHLQLQRPFSKFDSGMRRRMMHGSRLYLAQAMGGFAEASAERGAARSGWSWGVAAADFDNDGFQDLYVANGMESRETVRDYDSEFWLHDIFLADSKGTEVLETYFAVKGAGTRGRGMSYGGFEKNRLYLNRAGARFEDVAHLLGVALEADCRNLVATDLDNDGKVDLVITSIEVVPPYQQRLHVFRNEMPVPGHWIGFQFREEPGTSSPVGVRVRISAGNQSQVQPLVTGDSFRSQHPLVVRFGTGPVNSIDAVEIKWPGGETFHLARPAINQLNSVQKSARSR